ncbi:putative receptor protein kinase Zmpk1 [Stylosanthes scabra]|uniref:Receptor protein kinase Zmpk1 n=1 Tax=Stylosanthes scabra TaxID=79078 RepID=A0ABU6R5W0_9FABA|nr:putative receptor protein kinase Zmpk1 [Stylosanthes scabra]
MDGFLNLNAISSSLAFFISTLISFENGSLADNLSSNTLDWSKRYNIALGTARGLAYLHEECLEWILHCDIKPQNILLDSDYQPKVADFGLSKLLNRDDLNNTPNFSMIRGTRGVALDCIEEDKEGRPTMKQVVEMLQSHAWDPNGGA